MYISAHTKLLPCLTHQRIQTTSASLYFTTVFLNPSVVHFFCQIIAVHKLCRHLCRHRRLRSINDLSPSSFCECVCVNMRDGGCGGELVGDLGAGTHK